MGGMVDEWQSVGQDKKKANEEKEKRNELE